jgi:hypothetical protein
MQCGNVEQMSPLYLFSVPGFVIYMLILLLSL